MGAGRGCCRGTAPPSASAATSWTWRPTAGRRGAPPTAPEQLALLADPTADGTATRARRQIYHDAGRALGLDPGTIDALIRRALAAVAHRWLGFPCGTAAPTSHVAPAAQLGP